MEMKEAGEKGQSKFGYLLHKMDCLGHLDIVLQGSAYVFLFSIVVLLAQLAAKYVQHFFDIFIGITLNVASFIVVCSMIRASYKYGALDIPLAHNPILLKVLHGILLVSFFISSLFCMVYPPLKFFKPTMPF
mmetsp:Transcript_8599/g.12676  ORF Transcript_8599/g.12676 Transcript_8599/m.12676 type:complete len:132 (+) Transcript_8599:1222-1617(+)